MRYSTRQEGDVRVFDFKGNLEGGPEFVKLKEVLGGFLEAGERKFLLNMDGVGFCNSTGIGIVVTLFTSITNAGGKMKISNTNQKVSRVMMITKLLEVFDSYYQEKEALEAFAKGD